MPNSMAESENNYDELKKEKEDIVYNFTNIKF